MYLPIELYNHNVKLKTSFYIFETNTALHTKIFLVFYKILTISNRFISKINIFSINNV